MAVESPSRASDGGWAGGRMGGWADGRMGGWVDGWTQGRRRAIEAGMVLVAALRHCSKENKKEALGTREGCGREDAEERFHGGGATVRTCNLRRRRLRWWTASRCCHRT